MGCCQGKEQGVYKEGAQRVCTDILFLILLLVAIAASITVSVLSITSNPQLLIDILYPPDGYGNNCGYKEFSSLKKVVYPRLDSDFNENIHIAVTGQWWNFKPTGICTSSCPQGFDLANPILYGGPSYPCNENCQAAGGVPDYYYTYPTTDIVGRCIPGTKTEPGNSRELCVIPDCTSSAAAALNLEFGNGSVTCTTVESQPDANTTWEVCPPRPHHCHPGTLCCDQQRAACPEEGKNNGTLRVREETYETFTPSEKTDEDNGFTRTYANYVSLVLGGYEGLVVTEGLIAWLVFGVGVPLAMAFVWALLLFFFAGIIVWFLLFALVTMMIILDLVLCLKAGFFSLDELSDLVGQNASLTSTVDVSEAQGTWKTWFMVLAVIAIISTVLVILFIILWRKCIARLIAILKEVTKVFRSMIFIVFWPCWDLMGQALVVTYGFFTLYFCANAPESLFPHVGWKILALIGQVFVVFWTSQFIRATIWTSMSAAISRWYVTDNAVFAEKKCCGFGTGLGALMGGTCIIVTKHLGSMAFGALIIAVMQTIRAIVLAIDKNTQELQKGNCLLRLTFQCVQCCLACIQRTVEMITYYGFVFVAMRGDPFCRACGETMGFIAKYTAQTAVNQTVVRLLNILIGWSTPMLSAALAFLYLEYGAGDYPEQYNTLWTSAITFLTSFIVTSGVTMVYDCAIDTIYLCAFKDLDDPGGPKFMSNDLREGFGLDKAAEEVGEKAANYKSQTQRRREKKENAYAATPADGAQSGMDIRQDSSVATVDQV